MPTFILEIGTEEIPARFLPGLERELEARFGGELVAAGFDDLHTSQITVCGTPRRQAVYIEDLPARSAESEKVVTGPPLRVAFDAAGQPSKAALGFAKTQGVDFAETFKLETDKGEYLAARVKSGGEGALEILARLCPKIITTLPFPKRMHWDGSGFTFARPLRWLLALLDGEVVPFKVGDVESGRVTRGHRVLGLGPWELDHAAAYFALMREKARITPSARERGALILTGGDALAAEAGGRILWKDSLLEEVTGLTEHPAPLLGSFDPDFLEVPREVLLTSMESHQKSFGVEGPDGKLLPHFLTVLNITPKDRELVRRGWERVLRARLEDARFFWHTDLKGNFDAWLDRLDNVVFLAGIGSMGEKTRRISELTAWLAAECAGATDCAEGVNPADAARAGLLSKADLVTEMVGEFDSLQGIMGGIYAREKGENAVVSAALAEQYLPAGPESPLPATLCGALVSVADKADTLAGCFGLGLVPTGATDPYALRRCALGIARIIVEKKLRLDVRALFKKALALYGERQWKLAPEEALTRLNEFFSLRLKNYFTGQGAETLLAESVIAAGLGDVWDASRRLEALKGFASRPDFSEAVLTFKRPANIIRKQGESARLDGRYDPDLLPEPAEKELAATLERLRPRFREHYAAGAYDDLFELLYQLKPIVDGFFTDVMVMCEDEKLRLNRLNLLFALVAELKGLADFDALQV